MRMSDDQFKAFLVKCKLYFSSLSARGTHYAYFNTPLPCDLVLTNSTSPKPSKMSKSDPRYDEMKEYQIRVSEHGDRLTSYSVTDLSMHLLDIKDKSFVDTLRRVLYIPDTGYFVVNIVKFTSLLGSIGNNIRIRYDERNNLIMSDKDSSKIDIGKNYIGHPVHDYHVVSRLRYFTDVAYDTITEDHREEYPRVIKSIDPKHTLMTGRLFFLDIDTWEYATEDGRVIFPNRRPKMHVLCIDGLTCVSLKEFIPKFKKKPYTLDVLTWAVEEAYVLAVSRFTSDEINVISFRPNIVTYPCPDLPIATVNLGAIDTVQD